MTPEEEIRLEETARIGLEYVGKFHAERERSEALEAVLRDFVDDEPCRYDHNDQCQTHFLGRRPCENERAKELLAEVRVSS